MAILYYRHLHKMIHHFIPQVFVNLHLLGLHVLAYPPYLLNLIVLILYEIDFPALSGKDHQEYRSSNCSAMLFISVILDYGILFCATAYGENDSFHDISVL